MIEIKSCTASFSEIEIKELWDINGHIEVELSCVFCRAAKKERKKNQERKKERYIHTYRIV